VRVLISEIVTGVREAGSQLPRETDLVEEFDVSRGVVRESIRALEEKYLVTVKHGKGATVLASSHWDMLDPDVLAAVLESSWGPQVLGEYLECRRILEVEAAGLAAERAGETDLEHLAQALSRMEAVAGRPPGHATEAMFHEADLAFHATLIAATDNHALSSLVGRIHKALLTARFPTARPEYRVERSLPEHEAILKAVASGNARAARKAMAAHLDTVAEYLGEYAGEQNGRILIAADTAQQAPFA
jgi:GntR family transcriptional repressor for pyruvate dehydrogenase complex